MKPRVRRILGGTFLVIVALILGIGLAIWILLDRTLPPVDGTIRLAGIDGEVEITYDSMGIAQIWADTQGDALFGLGWLHASDRMFQLDMNRRVSQGRLSELLGPSPLAFDKERRRDGHARMARSAIATMSIENRGRLQKYADGINAYRRHGGSPPFEYILLQKDFEEWQVYDCLTALSFMTWYSDALQNRDGFFASLVRDGHADALRILPIGYPSWGPTTVKAQRSDAGASWRERLAGRFAEGILDRGAESFTASKGSNAWAVAPFRSESGKALFCSDPHLEITRLPQFWYAVGVHVRESGLDAVGVTIPGLPFIVMGHNGKAAWAFTAGGVDVVDYRIERINPEDSTAYLKEIDPSRGADSLLWESMELITDTFMVAFTDSAVIMTTRVIEGRPVIDDFAGGDTVYSWRWAGQDADLDRAVSAGFDLMSTANFESFRHAVTSMGALNANWMYADRAGNIGYQLGAPVPIRGEASPFIPTAGWIAEYDWVGYLTPDERPWELNPPEGWLANCNNLAGEGVNIPGTYAADRILRITELLQSGERFSPADMERFQMDQVDIYRMRWKALIDSIAPTVEDTTGALEAVARWSGEADTSSVAAGLVVVFIDELIREVFADELPNHFEQIRRFSVDEVMFGDDSVWIDDLLTPGHRETRFEIARRALTKALRFVGGREWGEIQTLGMAHPMANVAMVGKLIDLEFGPWPRGGTSGTLNSAYQEKTGDGKLRAIVGPSWRFVLDFADVDGATMVLPAGNSGNPLSEHFFDFNEMWRDGRRWNVPISRERVYARARSVLTLSPADSVVVGQK